MFAIVCKVTGERFLTEAGFRTEMVNCRNSRCDVPGLQDCYNKYGRRSLLKSDLVDVQMLERSDGDGNRVALFAGSEEAAKSLGKKNGKSIDKAVKSGKTVYGSHWKIVNVKG